LEKKKDDQQKYISRIENALENTTKDYLKLKQNFENELGKKTEEIQSYVIHLEKEINQNFERLKILEQNRPKYYSSRL